MAANDGDANVPIHVELVPDSSTDPAASRIPRAVAAAAVAPGAVAAFFAADDGERSVYNDPAALRAGGRVAPTQALRFLDPRSIFARRSTRAVQTAAATRPVGSAPRP